MTYNNPELTARVLPSLRKVAGEANVKEIPLITGAEDFAYFAQKRAGLLFHGGRDTRRARTCVSAPANHSPLFYLDETALPIATRAIDADGGRLPEVGNGTFLISQ